MPKYFIKCDICGQKIYLGEEVYQKEGYCGCYCSAECFAASYATVNTLSLEEVDNCCQQLYKEERKSLLKNADLVTETKVDDLSKVKL